jgi:Ca2+-binding EF-hand superfamily protein
MGGLGEKLSDDDIEDMMKEADLTGDRQINYSECVAPLGWA